MSAEDFVVEYIDEKIDLVLEAPETWGGVEPLEPLILMLLMLRQYAAFHDDDERKLMRDYRRHLSQSVGKGVSRLIERLPGEDKCNAAIDVLSAFVEHQRERDLSG